MRRSPLLVTKLTKLTKPKNSIAKGYRNGIMIAHSVMGDEMAVYSYVVLA